MYLCVVAFALSLLTVSRTLPVTLLHVEFTDKLCLSLYLCLFMQIQNHTGALLQGFHLIMIQIAQLVSYSLQSYMSHWVIFQMSSFWHIFKLCTGFCWWIRSYCHGWSAEELMSLANLERFCMWNKTAGKHKCFMMLVRSLLSPLFWFEIREHKWQHNS